MRFIKLIQNLSMINWLSDLLSLAVVDVVILVVSTGITVLLNCMITTYDMTLKRKHKRSCVRSIAYLVSKIYFMKIKSTLSICNIRILGHKIPNKNEKRIKNHRKIWFLKSYRMIFMNNIFTLHDFIIEFEIDMTILTCLK